MGDQEGSFENEALDNEDRSTKHPNLENEALKSRNEALKSRNEAPKSRKRSTQISKTKHPKTRKRRPLNLKPVCPL